MLLSLGDGMVEFSFGDWRIAADPDLTRRVQKDVSSPDPKCCNACATLVVAVEHDALPASFVDFLERAGVDPLKPQEVWGAPDGGFLSAWWVFAGSLLSGCWTGGAEGSYTTVAPGFRCWITDELSMRSPEGFGDSPLLQVEMIWEGDEPKRIEKAAWTDI